MAEPTVSRKTLRRAIGRKARMAFYRKYPNNYLTVGTGGDSGASTNTLNEIYCTDLTQADNFWQGWFFYVLDADTTLASGEERVVAAFDAMSQKLELEYDLSAIPASTAEFELLRLWSAQDIHDEINNVIGESWKVFPKIITDRKLIVQEDKLEYSTSDFSTDPAYILSIQVERTGAKYYGVCSAGSTSGPTFTATDIGIASTDLSTDYYWSFYYGTGSGQSGEVTSGDSDDVITVTSSDLADAPDTTTKYVVWQYTKEDYGWYNLDAIRWEQVEWPTNFFVTENLDGVFGMRFKVKYIAGNAELSADSDVTQIPKYYLVHKVLAYLHDSLVGDNRRDRQMHAGVAEYYDTLAERFAQKYPKRTPPGTVWNEDQLVDVSTIDNPLGW